MIRTKVQTALLALATSVSMPSFANELDVEGVIESIDSGARSVVVDGQRYDLDERTDFDDDLVEVEVVEAGRRLPRPDRRNVAGVGKKDAPEVRGDRIVTGVLRTGHENPPRGGSSSNRPCRAT